MHSSSVHPRYMDNMLIKWSFYTRWIQRLAACNPRRPSAKLWGRPLSRIIQKAYYARATLCHPLTLADLGACI